MKKLLGYISLIFILNCFIAITTAYAEEYPELEALKAQHQTELENFSKNYDTEFDRFYENGESSQFLDNYMTKKEKELKDLESNFAAEEAALINKLQDPDYVPSTIEKPTTLPGPTGDAADRASLTSSILPRIAVGIIGFAGAVALVFLIIGGVRYATAYGEDEAVEKAKKQVMYAIIGFFLAILSYTIVTIITNLNFGA
jgi:hypothetical protein